MQAKSTSKARLGSVGDRADDTKSQLVQVKSCTTSTETIKNIRNGEPKTFTHTHTELSHSSCSLNFNYMLSPSFLFLFFNLFWREVAVGLREVSWPRFRSREPPCPSSFRMVHRVYVDGC